MNNTIPTLDEITLRAIDIINEECKNQPIKFMKPESLLKILIKEYGSDVIKVYKNKWLEESVNRLKLGPVFTTGCKLLYLSDVLFAGLYFESEICNQTNQIINKLKDNSEDSILYVTDAYYGGEKYCDFDGIIEIEEDDIKYSKIILICDNNRLFFGIYMVIGKNIKSKIDLHGIGTIISVVEDDKNLIMIGTEELEYYSMDDLYEL